MLKTNKNQILLFAFMFAIVGFSSCSKKSDPAKEETKEKDYSFFVGAGTPSANYILHAASLTEGTATTAGNGVETDLTVVTTKGGYYYATNTAGNLVKFTSDNKKITTVKEIPFNKISWAYWSSFYIWKDDKTLVFFSVNGGRQYEYATLDVENMTFTASGNINIPVPPTGYYYWGNSAVFVGNKLYISYTSNADANDLSVDESYLAAIDYPAMNNITVTKDTRFNFPSHYTLHMPGALSYNGTAYFLNSPTIWSTAMQNKPFAIYKVNNGSTAVDANYVYELTDRTKEEAMGLFDAGNGKAIVKVLDKTQIDGTSAYNSKFITDYYVIDVVNKTKIKINMPKSVAGGYTQNVLIEGDDVFIAAKATEGFYVYHYSLSSQIVKRGLKLDGVNSLYRFERMK